MKKFSLKTETVRQTTNLDTVDKCDNYVANSGEMGRKHKIECGADGKVVLEASREEVKLQLNEEALGAAPPHEPQQLEKVKKEACV